MRQAALSRQLPPGRQILRCNTMAISDFANPGSGSQRLGDDPRLHLVRPLSSPRRALKHLQPGNALVICLQESLQSFLQRGAPTFRKRWTSAGKGGSCSIRGGLASLTLYVSAEAYSDRTAVVRIRMPGGVGGETPRGVPLSRSLAHCGRSVKIGRAARASLFRPVPTSV